MATLELTDSNFNDTVENNDIVFVDFWAPWCGPCRAFGPVFEKAAQENTDITFGKINTEDQQALAAAFNIRSIPTLMVFREKVLIFAQPGMLPAPALTELIGKVRELDMEEVRKAIAAQDSKEPASQQAAAN